MQLPTFFGPGQLASQPAIQPASQLAIVQLRLRCASVQSEVGLGRVELSRVFGFDGLASPSPSCSHSRSSRPQSAVYARPWTVVRAMVRSQGRRRICPLAKRQWQRQQLVALSLEPLHSLSLLSLFVFLLFFYPFSPFGCKSAYTLSLYGMRLEFVIQKPNGGQH